MRHSCFYATMWIFLFAQVPGVRAADGTIDLLLDPTATTFISQPGSYVLVSNVTMNAGVSALGINNAVSDVVIDLGGHVISSAGGIASGIYATNATSSRVTIRNGSIIGFGGFGIMSGGSSEWTLTDIKVSGCGSSGILLGGTDNVLERCIAIGNNITGGNPAVQIGSNSIAKDCIAKANSPASGGTWGFYSTGTVRFEGCLAEANNAAGGSVRGIQTGANSVVQNCVVRNHTASNNCVGIFSTGSGTIISDSVVANNDSTFGGTYGIQGGDLFIVQNCTVDDNDCSSSFVYGISVGSRCSVLNNLVRDQTSGGTLSAHGISAGADCTIRGNGCFNNDAGGTGMTAYGIFASAGAFISENTCSDNNEGTVTGTSYGIVAGAGSRVLNNVCRNNDSNGPGSARGISASESHIEGNICTGNDAIGDGTSGLEYASGIYSFGGCTVVNNQVSANVVAGGTQVRSFGILASGTDNVIAGNHTIGHTDAGIAFTSAGSFNRCHSNQCREVEVIESSAPGFPCSSVGIGDLENVLY